MSNNLQYTIINGVKCFNPEVANAYMDYPQSGFKLTDKNAKSSFWINSRNRLFKSFVNKNLSVNGKTKFLEIGCGTGDFIHQIVQNQKLEITGSEIYLNGLLYAKKNLPDVNLIQFDVSKGVLGEEFDLIVAFDVIEHIENDIAAIINVNKMLTKNGIFIVSVPQHMFLWSRLDEIVKHKRRYSRNELIEKLNKSGFEISYVTSFLFILFPLMLISRLFDRNGEELESDEVELQKRVGFPILLNWIFDKLMCIDETLIRFGISLPFGGTLLIVARKR